MENKINQYIGTKINMLEIKSFHGYRVYKTWNCPMVDCVCDCGCEKTIALASIINSHTKSCGCLQRSITSRRSVTHNMSKSRIYKIWAGMKFRCDAKNSEKIPRYKNIWVCDKWNTFDVFYRDMHETYHDGLSIDRIDNEKGYSKENCRWVTPKTQSRNTRRNIVFDGKTLAQISEESKIPYHRLYQRIFRLNKDIADAISMG